MVWGDNIYASTSCMGEISEDGKVTDALTYNVYVRFPWGDEEVKKVTSDSLDLPPIESEHPINYKHTSGNIKIEFKDNGPMYDWFKSWADLLKVKHKKYYGFYIPKEKSWLQLKFGDVDNIILYGSKDTAKNVYKFIKKYFSKTNIHIKPYWR